jgi:DNA-binding NtrC family response regulator
VVAGRPTEAAAEEAEGARTLREQLQSAEQEILFEALRSCGGDRSAAARRLGISRSSIYAKLGQGDR